MPRKRRSFPAELKAKVALGLAPRHAQEVAGRIEAAVRPGR